MNCQEITNNLQIVKSQRAQLESFVNEKKINEALTIKSEISESVKRFLEKLNCFEIEGKRFPIFSLEIGGKDENELLKEFDKGGIKMTLAALSIINKINFLKKPEKINLIRLTVGDLGFDDGAKTKEIYTRARKLGLDLCPAEVGPYLRLKDKEQLTDELYYIAMEEINVGSEPNNPRVFGINRSGLGTFDSLGELSPNQGIVFRILSVKK